MLLTWLQQTPGWVLPGASLDMNFAAGTYYPAGGVGGLITTTRAQTVSSYATTSTGSLTAFAANTPRITDLGLLVEQAATNLFLNSVGFGTGWGGNRGGSTASIGVGTANFAVAPDGTTTATRVQLALNGATTSADISEWIVTPSVTISNATVYTQGIWIKSNTGSSINMSITDVNNSGSQIVVTTTWTRFTLTATSSGTSANFQLRLRGAQTPVNPDTADISIWGGQLELGTFATSNIPTTTVAVARAADNITLAGTANSSALAANAAFFVTNLVAGGTSPRFFQTTSTANAFFNSTTQASITDSGGDTANATIGGAGTYTGVVRSAFGFDGTSMTAKANGGTQATSAHAWDGTTGTVTLGNNSALTRALNGYMARAVWGPVKGQFDGFTA